MNLSLSVLMGELSIKPEHIYNAENNSLVLSDIRRLPLDNEPCEDDILYFENWLIIKTHPEVCPKYLICIGGGADSEVYFNGRGICGAIFSEMERTELFSRIQEIFLSFNRLEVQLMSAIIQRRSTVDILDICSRFFQGHASLFDDHLYLIGAGSLFLPEDARQELRETLDNRKLSSRLSHEIRRMDQAEDAPAITNAHFYSMPDGFANILLCPVFHSSLRTGRIGVIMISETLRPLSASFESILDHIAKIVNPIIAQRYASQYDVKDPLRTLLSRMLNGVETDALNIENTLHRVNWDPNDDFCLLTISIPRLKNGNGNEFRYIYEYEDLFPDCVGFIFYDDILLVVHNDNKGLVAGAFPKLTNMLQAHDAVCGLSLPFVSISQISVQYLNSRLAIQHRKGDNRICAMRENLDQHLLLVVSAATSVTSFCHRSVIRLYEYDKKNGTDLVNTLEVYLRNDRSLKAAANVLFVHRNTLVYRLRCIESIARMNLDDSHEKLHILLSCIVLRLSGTQ